jgi:23S rRNA pseudouridine1911/1915/1917 synthase
MYEKERALLNPPAKSATKRLPKGIAILHEDEDILIAEKPPNMLTMATDKGEERTLYFFLTDYVRKGAAKSRKRIFIVHRLDRDASGVLVFAKNEIAQKRLQEQWADATKKYYAVVDGRVEKSAGIIESSLAENKAFFVYSTTDPDKGRFARTGYTVLKGSAHRTLLEVDLFTGRKHQIRVHLAEAGHPIVGDKKYGKKFKGKARLALHAYALAFKHPRSGKPIAVELEMPEFFRRLGSN